MTVGLAVLCVILGAASVWLFKVLLRLITYVQYYLRYVYGDSTSIEDVVTRGHEEWQKRHNR